ncbi:hypothetical protein B0J15DRAFT_483697 [Fusarium solani]|uniref:Uncharacterized protein n=1 Tax=Fusarium solani TaxID=169388 RepID=A0A9P9KZ01_FUSSL|nr:uncharacterized protein B0J15DRAFT_483697 [Fusarium solani]KAH7270920.1 hypothetical protein B0J15DRAFT_483697 [Fusarium solani]
MSFGWSAGDVFAAAQLLWGLYKALDEKEGAPEHHRRSASTLRTVQFRLRYLSKVVGEDANADPLSETEEASLLDSADKDDIRYTIVSLKLSVERLEALVAKGCGLKLDPAKKKRRRDWPMDQINKLRWYTLNQDEVDGLIQHMLELTAPLSDLHQKINTAVVKELAANQGVYHETQLKYLKTILEQVIVIARGAAQDQLLDLNNSEEGERQVPLLHTGPELGIPPAAEPEPTVGSALSHLTSIAREIMSPSLRTKVINLKADHHVKNVFTSWYKGAIPPRLWLHGDQAGTVSAIAYIAARDQRRPTIAFSCRHAADGRLLSGEDRLFRMVYSLLFQLLQQLEDIPTLAVTGVDRPFTDLQLSMESMPLALQYMRYFLSLLPECIVVVDGWHFISQDAGEHVKQTLKSFLDLFEKPQENAGDEDWCIRLLLTSPGNSSMLRELGQAYVHDFNLRGRLNTGAKLYTILLSMDW